MNDQPDNPPAFPWHPNGCHAPGMTLRDWFAGQALAGICTPIEGDDACAQWNHRMLANGAYAMADAMLRARQFQSPTTPKPASS